MRHDGSAAYRMDAPFFGQEAPQRASFVAVEGGRLDAQARRAPEPAFFRVVMLLVAVVICAFVVGGVSVSLTSGTVALLQENSAVSSKIKDVQLLNDDLRIERSLLTSSERISSIATQNLGMVYANTADHLEID